MKVSELMELLQECDPDAEVTIAHQPNYPFEYSIQGLRTREDVEYDAFQNDPDFHEDGEEVEWDAETFDYGTHNLPWRHLRKYGNDVILVEGDQLSYAKKEIWNR